MVESPLEIHVNITDQKLIRILFGALVLLIIGWYLSEAVPPVLAQAPPAGVQSWAPLNAPAFTGGITVTGVIGGSSDIYAGAAGSLYWNTRSQMLSASNGNIEMTNQARTGFTSLQFGCTANTCPELLVSGNALGIRNADGTVATYSQLTACAAGLEGAMAPISDSTVVTYNAAISGSGGNHVLAYCNGTAWVAH